jgi:hypothetical protein
MIALKLIPAPAPHAAVPELGYLFFALGAITLVGMVASLGESLALTAVLAPLWIGVALLGVFYTVGGSGWEKVGGYVTMASAFTAFYTASAMMLASTFGRVVLPLGKYRKAANVPGGQRTYPIQFELGEPGVKQGQVGSRRTRWSAEPRRRSPDPPAGRRSDRRRSAFVGGKRGQGGSERGTAQGGPSHWRGGRRESEHAERMHRIDRNRPPGGSLIGVASQKRSLEHLSGAEQARANDH